MIKAPPDLTYFELVRKDIGARLTRPWCTILVGPFEFRIIYGDWSPEPYWQKGIQCALVITATGPDPTHLELREQLQAIVRPGSEPIRVDLRDPASLPTIHNWIASYGIPIRK